MKILITGAAGFIGHHLVKYINDHTDHEMTFLDRLDCSGNMNRLADIEVKRSRFVFHDLKAEINDLLAKQIGEHDYVLHLGAATHVDRSITDPLSFVMDNVVGTCNLLNFVRKVGCGKMIYFSTDEVFGPAPDGVTYKEWDRYNSGNPYAASKAGAEELCLSFANTYKLPVAITHTMNVFGERQHPEKFIPNTVSKVLNGETVTIHSNREKTRAGSRFYIHADNVADALMFLLDKAEAGDKYNIVGDQEVSNLELAQQIANNLGRKLKYEMVDFHSSRPGHDLRYGLDGEKMKSLGWKHKVSFEDGLKNTVEWVAKTQSWQA